MQFRPWRFPCNHPVTVYSGAGRGTAVIINISLEGARLAQGPSVVPGELVRVELGPGCVPREAEVQWTRAGKLGLRFTYPLGARDMAMIRGTSNNGLPRDPACGPGRGAGAPRGGPLRELR